MYWNNVGTFLLEAHDDLAQIKEAEMHATRVNELEARLSTQGKLLTEREYENNQLRQAGEVTPGIDRPYPLNEAAKAMEYLEAGRARGKVIVSVQ